MQEQPGETQESVSEVLLRAREDYGQDLRSVSDSLRIRYIYLLAIEEGRFDDLPGATYAVGFVRTYADYLGLDSQEIVRRFKEEVEGLERRTQLVFPVPKPEGKIPGGAIILISLLLVGVAYGGWYVLSQNDQSLVELISGSPAGESQTAGGQAEPAPLGAETQESAAPEQSAAAEGAHEPVQESGAPAEAEAPRADMADDSAVETLPPEPPVETEVLPPPDDSGTAQAETGTAQAPAPEPAARSESAPQAPEAAAAEPEADQGAQAQPDNNASAAAETPIPAAPQSEQLASTPTGRVFGAEEGDVRIVVRAKQDAWVQVRNADNQLILTEVLRSGDIYRVPDETGLSMLTGNAGGLEILVDGQLAPTLGPIGVVRRNVVLDPQRLRSGTAVGEQRTE